MPSRIEAVATDCLMLGMAERLGAHPRAAIASGLLSGAELDRMVARCHGCARADACIIWLAESGPHAPVAPGYCLNGEELAALAKEQSP